MAERDPKELVTVTKKGHEDDVVPRWALHAREADGWKAGKAVETEPATSKEG